MTSTDLARLKPNLRTLIADAEAAGLSVEKMYAGTIGERPWIWQIVIRDERLRAPVRVNVSPTGSFDRATCTPNSTFKSVLGVRRILMLDGGR